MALALTVHDHFSLWFIYVWEYTHHGLYDHTAKIEKR